MNNWLDESHAPLDLLIFPVEYSYDELDEAFGHLEAAYKRFKERDPAFRRAILCDLTTVKKSSALNRKRVADSFHLVSKMVDVNVVGQAFIVSSPIARGALTAIFWIKGPPWPTKVFAKQRQGLAWLEGLLKLENMSVTMPPRWWKEEAQTDDDAPP